MAFDSFTNVARKLFAEGACNWGRIVALFLFGYTIACRFIRQGPSGIRRFLRRIVKFVIKFLFSERIYNWIKEQGGWVCIVQNFARSNLSQFTKILIEFVLHFFNYAP